MNEKTVTLESLQAELTSIRSLLEVLINQEKLHQVGGYAHGRTSRGDAFIILYPAATYLRHKVCRVYAEDFKALPLYIDTAVPAEAQEGNPDREQAQRLKIYRPCPPFIVATREGKETQMGPEVRFSRTVDAPDPKPAARRAARPLPDSVPPRRDENGRQTGHGKNRAEVDSDGGTAGRQEALTAVAPLLFDSAVVRLEPWFQDSEKVTSFREALFGEWQPEARTAYVAALERYAAVRKQIDGRMGTAAAHKEAKNAALGVYQELLDPAE